MTSVLSDIGVASAFGPIPITAGLDMWIADGGAASQLFALDTNVTRPVITGENLINDPGVDVTFGIFNLDSDVTSILLGSNSIGVQLVSGFVNNGDGTGSFQATFDPAVPSRQLTIIAKDDVDNESVESPIFVVLSIQQVTLNDEMSILPQQISSATTCQNLLDNVPESEFVLKRQYTVPYSFNTTAFELKAVTPNAPVTVSVVRRGLAGEPDDTQEYVIIPSKETEVLQLRLGRGVNVVQVSDRYGNDDLVVVAATSYASILCAYAREIFNNSQVLIDEQEAALFSPVSTRVAEPLLTFGDLMPDVRSQQVLATKLAVRSLVSGAGRQIGVRDILAALTLSTPIFKEEVSDPETFEPSIIPLYNSQEAFGGVEAHVWLANECVRRWLAFIQFLQNMSAFRIISISESTVIFEDDNGDVKRHVFDFADDKCSLTDLVLQSSCFESIDINVAIFSESDMVICAPAYPFDMRPTPSHPMQPLFDEQGVGGLDPGFDGYIDFSVTDHWDSGALLDSLGPSPSLASGDTSCVYDNGYLVAPILLASADADVDAILTMDGTYDVDRAVGAVVDVSIDLAGIEVASSMDLYITPFPFASARLGVSILATQSPSVGLSIAITDPPSVAASLSIVISD